MIISSSLSKSNINQLLLHKQLTIQTFYSY